jgi:predicted phage-related endonuclease
MSDFSPETRNSAWWSGDSRRAASGKANEVILTKQGKLEIPDLSNIEAVQMGHVMEPVIGNLASERLGVRLEKIEEALTHPQHPWLKSHFDFHGKLNGETILVECKNYNAAVRNKFDESGLVPAADMAQLIHEAAVYGIRKIYLAVLFGGQEFVLIPFEITDEQKEELIKQMAVYWGHCQAGTQLPPETPEQARLIYPTGLDTTKMASRSVEEACRTLTLVKGQIKALEAQKEALETLVQGYMGEANQLATFDGSVLATWKNAKTSEKFDSKLFQSAMPDVYEKFVVNVPGSRRFLVK